MPEMTEKRQELREVLRVLSQLVDTFTNDLEDVRYALILTRPGPENKGADTMMESNLTVENAASIFQQAADRLLSGQANVQAVEEKNPCH